MGRTWQIFARICLPCGRNLSSVDIAKCDPSFQVRKNFENRQKHQRRRSAWVGHADFGKLELNNRNHSDNCQRLVMNVIHLKHDQFKINGVEFSDLREEASTRLSFAIPSFFRKLSTGKDFTRLRTFAILRVLRELALLKANQFPSTQANTSQVCYSPSQMYYSHPSTFRFFFICPILLKLGMEEKDRSTEVRRKKRKMFSGIWRS